MIPGQALLGRMSVVIRLGQRRKVPLSLERWLLHATYLHVKGNRL